MSTPPRDRAGAPQFPTTCWSRVIAAGDPDAPDTRAALEELGRAYWYPLYAFVRRQGRGPDAAADLVQALFARLLEKGRLAAADPARGRFRSFLLADCQHFLADQHDRAAARKRGGGRAIVPIEARDAEGRYRAEPAHGLTAERLYERAWAVALLGRALERLRAEHEAAGRGPLFEGLKAALADDPDALPYRAIAAGLGTTEGAVQVAAHRLRRRYRELIRAEIAATVADPAEVEDEIRALFTALGD